MTVINSISTLVSNRQNNREISNIRDEIGHLENKIGSDHKYDSFLEAEPDQIKILSELEYAISHADKRIESNNLLQSKLEQYENSINSLQQTFDRALIFAIQANNPVLRPNLEIELIADQFISSVKSALNIDFNGQFLFGGSRSDVPPVGNINTISNINADGTLNIAYYQGNDVIQSQQISDNVTLQYGDTADNSTYQNFFAGLNYLKRYPTTNNIEDLASGLNLLQEVGVQLTQKIATIGNYSAQVENQIELDKSLGITNKEFYKVAIETDFISATNEFHHKIAKLQAMFMIARAAREMSIVDYIR